MNPQNGDKVICLYRSKKVDFGRIRVGIGTVRNVKQADKSDITYYIICLDIGHELISVMNVYPYGAVVHYTDELEKELRIYHSQIIRQLEKVQQKYFGMLGKDKDDWKRKNED